MTRLALVAGNVVPLRPALPKPQSDAPLLRPALTAFEVRALAHAAEMAEAICQGIAPGDEPSALLTGLHALELVLREAGESR